MHFVKNLEVERKEQWKSVRERGRKKQRKIKLKTNRTKLKFNWFTFRHIVERCLHAR